MFLFGNMVLYDHVNSKTLKPWMIIGGLAMLTSFTDLFFDIRSDSYAYFRLVEVLYFLILTVRLFIGILRQKKVDDYVMVNAIICYMLIGMSWGLVSALLSTVNPDSYSIVLYVDARLYDFMYYAFVTMSTLGYGEILPLSVESRSLTVFIVISGVFFTTIVLGTIVGKFIANEQSKEK
jgi:voltage-gated potassium channel